MVLLTVVTICLAWHEAGNELDRVRRLIPAEIEGSNLEEKIQVLLHENKALQLEIKRLEVHLQYAVRDLEELRTDK